MSTHREQTSCKGVWLFVIVSLSLSLSHCSSRMGAGRLTRSARALIDDDSLTLPFDFQDLRTKPLGQSVDFDDIARTHSIKANIPQKTFEALVNQIQLFLLAAFPQCFQAWIGDIEAEDNVVKVSMSDCLFV